MLDLLKKRRSIRKFTETKVSDESRDLILKAGLLAPTGMGIRHIEFICIENKESIESLANIKAHGASPFKTATLAIVVLGDTQASKTWLEDASIATSYMQLQIEELGLGSTWIQLNKRQSPSGEDSDQILRAYFGYPEHMSVLCALAIGHKNESKDTYTDEFIDFSKVHKEKY